MTDRREYFLYSCVISCFCSTLLRKREYKKASENSRTNKENKIKTREKREK
jgi:hypothetical protein